MKHKLIILLSMIVFAFLLNSCTSCSKSGRAKIIALAMAKNEARKKVTLPTPETIKIDTDPKIIEVTPDQEINNELIIKEAEKKNNKKIPEAEGVLIQVEGLIAKEVSELTIDLDTGSNQIKQIIELRDYVYSKWHYVFDPASGHDTWRSAEATLSLKYKGKYPGDCDDYAILMASFARQIGLESRVIGAYNTSGSGHAFAEFLVPKNELNNKNLKGKDYREDFTGKWVSLDWFSGAEHKEYKINFKIIAQ